MASLTNSIKYLRKKQYKSYRNTFRKYRRRKISISFYEISITQYQTKQTAVKLWQIFFMNLKAQSPKRILARQTK